MDNFFKKALGLFVDFVPDEQGLIRTESRDLAPQDFQTTPLNENQYSKMETATKFEKHFEDLFTKSNLPGPDYFEFWKMMETLSQHVPDEKARMAAVYATLTVQGLSKDKLLQSAKQYKRVIENDKSQFEIAARQKMQSGVDAKKSESEALVRENAAGTERIRELSAAIAANQEKIRQLQTEVGEEEQKLLQNRSGYQLAFAALLAKINDDINKIDNTL